MAPPTHLPRFTELPVDVQRHVFDLAAIGASTGWPIWATLPILTTRMQVSITRMPQLPEDSTSNAAAGEYHLEIERTYGQNQYMPLLRLCRDARAAMAEQEVFVVTMHPYATGWVQRVTAWARDLWSQRATVSPPLPLFGGVTRELLLAHPSEPNPEPGAHQPLISMAQVWHLVQPSDPNSGYDAHQALISMAQVFGTQVRRIHLCEVTPSGWSTRHAVRSKQTDKTYYFPQWFMDSEWKWHLEETINAQFPKLPALAEDGHRRVDLRRRGEFADEEAKEFWLIRPCGSIDQHAEVIRQYPDGRTLINSAVKKSLAEHGYPTVTSTDLLQQAAVLATRYFPLLEYISVLVDVN